MFNIGDKVIIGAKFVKNYEGTEGKILVVIDISISEDEHPLYDISMDGMPLYDLEFEDGSEFNYSLYEYELIPA